jgi:hypothetical protein
VEFERLILWDVPHLVAVFLRLRHRVDTEAGSKKKRGIKNISSS